ncbi:DivIVA domain-containing protein [Eupransor demetentiae]|uniref:Interacts with FtsZ and MinD (DivIVA) n=1 Tax=Eupransor demetentiae TaxID=3109584 RepID=A0ABM9N3L4_9LACO|nr:Cell division septum initiation protein DivIVA [Lactobacillaceae bacterium LMG 33000]
MVQVKYTQKDIYERVFKQKRMGVGYDPQDVDDFLDGVISDYGVFNDRIEQLQKEVAKLQSALKAAQDELAAGGEGQQHATQIPVTPARETAKPSHDGPVSVVDDSETAPAASAESNNVTNLDLIKRVANLERAVFGHERG